MRPAAAVLTWLLLLIGSAALAGEPEEAAAAAEYHSAKGVEFYKAGQYPEAIREMLAAYHAVPDPTLLYNVARIYEAMEQRGLAVEYFTRYVKSDDADPDTVQEALERMAVLQAGPAPETEVLVESQTASSDRNEAARVATPAGSATARVEAHPSAPLDVLPFAALAVAIGSGSLLAATGIGALVQQNQAQDVSFDYETRLAAQRRASDLATAADLAMGFTVGSAITTGVFLAVRAAQTKGAISLVPVGPGGSAGLSLAVRFGPDLSRSP